uniref:Uncharacterized protein n=1 Tax=Setaria italica TaxID=4555 RepID=K3XU04_SETIT
MSTLTISSIVGLLLLSSRHEKAIFTIAIACSVSKWPCNLSSTISLTFPEDRICLASWTNSRKSICLSFNIMPFETLIPVKISRSTTP